MPTSGWLRWTLAVAMVAVALYHLGRLATVRRRRPRSGGKSIQVDVELNHAAMGAGMTVMVLSAAAPAGLRGLGLAFVAAMLWFASRTVHSYATGGARSADVSARQVIGCAAMAYMLLVLAVPSAMSGAMTATMTGTMTGAMHGMSMSSAGNSVVHTLSAPVFRLLVAGATVAVAGWIVRRQVRSADRGPALSLGCQLAVSATTVYMLAAM